MKSPTSCRGQAALLVQAATLQTCKYLIKTDCKICHRTGNKFLPLPQRESVRGGRHAGVVCTGRGNGEMEETPQSGHLLAQVTLSPRRAARCSS